MILIKILNFVSKLLYLMFVSKHNQWYFYGLLFTFLGPIVLTSVLMYRMDLPEFGFCAKFFITLMIIFNVFDQLLAKTNDLTIQDKVLDKPRFLFLLQNCTYFFLELFNNMDIGETWSWLQVISPTLTILLMVSPFIRREGLDGRNMVFIFICNISLLFVYIYIRFFVFSTEDDRPQWAKIIPNIRIGTKWI